MAKRLTDDDDDNDDDTDEGEDDGEQKQRVKTARLSAKEEASVRQARIVIVVGAVLLLGAGGMLLYMLLVSSPVKEQGRFAERLNGNWESVSGGSVPSELSFTKDGDWTDSLIGEKWSWKIMSAREDRGLFGVERPKGLPLPAGSAVGGKRKPTYDDCVIEFLEKDKIRVSYKFMGLPNREMVRKGK